MIVGGSTDHDPVYPLQVVLHLGQLGNAAVDFNPQVGKFLLEAIDIAVAQGGER